MPAFGVIVVWLFLQGLAARDHSDHRDPGSPLWSAPFCRPWRPRLGFLDQHLTLVSAPPWGWLARSASWFDDPPTVVGGKRPEPAISSMGMSRRDAALRPLEESARRAGSDRARLLCAGCSLPTRRGGGGGGGGLRRAKNPSGQVSLSSNSRPFTQFAGCDRESPVSAAELALSAGPLASVKEITAAPSPLRTSAPASLEFRCASAPLEQQIRRLFQPGFDRLLRKRLRQCCRPPFCESGIGGDCCCPSNVALDRQRPGRLMPTTGPQRPLLNPRRKDRGLCSSCRPQFAGPRPSLARPPPSPRRRDPNGFAPSIRGFIIRIAGVPPAFSGATRGPQRAMPPPLFSPVFSRSPGSAGA